MKPILLVSLKFELLKVQLEVRWINEREGYRLTIRQTPIDRSISTIRACWPPIEHRYRRRLSSALLAAARIARKMEGKGIKR